MIFPEEEVALVESVNWVFPLKEFMLPCIEYPCAFVPIFTTPTPRLVTAILGAWIVPDPGPVCVKVSPPWSVEVFGVFCMHQSSATELVVKKAPVKCRQGELVGTPEVAGVRFAY